MGKRLGCGANVRFLLGGSFDGVATATRALFDEYIPGVVSCS